MDQLRVSVVIRCFNPGGHRLEAAWRSALAQTEPVEIILVNDGSDDASTLSQIEEISEDPSTRVIDIPNGGVAEARNTGIRVCAGRYVLSLDSDDMIEPDYARRAADLLDADERLGIVYCRADRFTDAGERLPWDLPPYVRADMALFNLIHGTAMYRRKDWDAVGGYRGLRFDDYDLWLSILELGRGVRRIEDVLLHYRVTPDSIITSMDDDAEVAAQLDIYRHHPEFLLENIEHVLSHYRAQGEMLAHLKRRYGVLERGKERVVTAARRIRGVRS